MEPRKQAIIDALRKFMNQRSGIEFGNYGDVKAFRAEQRSITKDLREARELMRAVELSDGITADDLVKAAQGAYGGRLTITVLVGAVVSVTYCTGQYFPTEYRRTVCAVLALALWEYTREHCMPAPSYVEEFYKQTPGDWLRAHFHQQFGRGIASRWFS